MLIRKVYLLLGLMAFYASTQAQSTFEETIAFIDGLNISDKTEVFFRKYDPHRPDCPEPKNLQLIENDKGLLVSWEGPTATFDGARYFLKYRSYDQSNIKSDNWSEILVTEGNNYLISDPMEGYTYEVTLKKYCGGSGSNFEAESKWLSPKKITISENKGGGSGQGSQPDCREMEGANVSAASSTSIKVEWNGPVASPTGARYKIQYKEAFVINGNWEEIFAMNGTSVTIGPLVTATQYEIRIKMVYGGSGANYQVECDWINLGIHATNYSDGNGQQNPPTNNPPAVISLPAFECGDNVTPPSTQNINLLVSADTTDLFNIRGFPVLLKVVLGGNGIFSGQGIVPLPYGGKVIRVSFTNITVNTDYQIINGTLNAISDSPGNYPDFVQQPVNFGGEICVDPPSVAGFDDNGIYQPNGTPYNPLGFDVNGNYILDPPYPGYEPGDPFDPNYDPNGFGPDGNHILTNSPFNENGCNQLGFNETGQPCDPTGEGPYYWLNEDESLGAPTEAGINFANQIAGSLDSLVIVALQSLSSENQAKVNQYRNNSNAIRGAMENLLSNLGYQRQFIFGANDKYIVEGMHKEFAMVPQPISLNIDRNPNQIALETNHIALYHQDDTLGVYVNTQIIIVAEQVLGAVGISVDELLELIKRFTVEEVAEYSIPANLSAWVHEKMEDKIKSIYSSTYGDGFGSMDVEELLNKANRKLLPAFDFSTRARVYPTQFLAMSDGNGEAIFKNAIASAFSMEDREAIDFEFNQGWEMVNGVHRAFYLDHIAKQRAIQTGSENNDLLPIRISKEISGREYTIYLDNITFTPGGATLDAYFILEIPTTGDKLLFKALNVSFGTTGSSAQTKLNLETDIGIRLSNAARLIIKGTEDTFVSWDCDGFAGLGVDAEIEFCRKYLIPLGGNNLDPLPEPERVKGHFIITIPSWEELIVNLNMTPFAVAGLEDVKWQVQNVVLDFSDTQTPNQIVFPSNYNSPFVNNGQASPLWRGFYLKQLSVTLPNKFNEGSQPVTVGVQDVIIDAMGFTGRAFASPILSLEQGNLNGWAFSIDTFGISVVANHLVGADFNGHINIPLFSGGGGNSNNITEADCLEYTAMILPDNAYHFAVSPGSNYNVNIWKATATIDSNSVVAICYVNNEFKVAATLNGIIQVDADLGSNIDIKLPTVRFQDVVLQNQEPYFSPGIWSFPINVGVKFAGMNISLTAMDLKKTTVPNEMAMDINAIFNLTDDETSVSAGGGVSLIGEMVETNGKQKWQYKTFKVKDIILNASFSGVTSVHGELNFFENHATYGTGFRGLVSANFEAIGVELQAAAQFGRKSDYKYFFVDVMANLTPGIDFGGMKLISFGGGVYYHMNRPASSVVIVPAANNQNGTPQPPPLGQSLSGIIYTPDPTKLIGLKATIGFATTNEKVFNGNATFEILFNQNFSLSDIWIYGNGRFMEDFTANLSPSYTPNQKPNNNAAMSVVIDMHYAFGGDDPGFDASLQTYLNVGNGLIKGSGPNDRMGLTEIHFSSDSWYINVGTPSVRNGIVIGIDGVGSITTGSYMDIGTNIPPMPDLPAQVTALTGAGNFMLNESIRASGHGFAFGASLNLNTGNKTFLVYYASFHLGLGFDMMLQNYNGAYCLQSGDEIGINGWYASGQMWAYAQGEIGIKVKVFGVNKQYKILSIAAAAALQAKLPNPFWAKGVVGGQYSILGGTIKGNCHFEFTIGEACTVVGGSNPVQDIQLISNISPADNTSDIPVFTQPRAMFNIPIGETFELPNLNGNLTGYTVSLDYARILYNGSILLSASEWDYSKQMITLTPYEVMPADDSLDFEVKVTLRNLAGTFIKSETMIARFYTAPALDIIPEINVKASYPLNGQYNFYKKEIMGNVGYILLKQGQSDLFYNVPEGYIQRMEMVDAATKSVKWSQAVTYDAGQRKVKFTIPYIFMNNEAIYKMQLVNNPITPGTGAGSAGSSTASTQGNGGENDGGGTASGSGSGDNSSGGSASADEGLSFPGDTEAANGANNGPSAPPKHIIYEIYFRVSEYDKFIDKLNAFEAGQVTTFDDYDSEFYAKVSGFELFDDIEINGTDKVEPLLKCMGNLSTNNWLQDDIRPYVYDFLNVEVPEAGWFTYLNRDEEIYGDIPLKAVFFEQTMPSNKVHTRKVNFDIGHYGATLNNIEQKLNYEIFRTVYQDFLDVRTQGSNYMYQFQPYVGDNMNLTDAQKAQLIANALHESTLEIIYGNALATPPIPHYHFVRPPDDAYKVQVKYTLPGTTQVTTVHTIELDKN